MFLDRFGANRSSRRSVADPRGDVPPPTGSRVRDGFRAVPHTLVETWPGRALLLAGAIKLGASLLETTIGETAWLRVVGSTATLGLVASVGYFVLKALGILRRRLLWRVRRKLILSYVFIGFVPALLIAAFFVFGGLLLFFNVSSYLLKDGVDDLAREVQVVADAVALEIAGVSDSSRVASILEQRRARASANLPGLSIALVPLSPPRGTAAGTVGVGSWAQEPPPRSLPAWVAPSGFSGLVALAPERAETLVLSIRAVGQLGTPESTFAAVADVPIAAGAAERLREMTGVELVSVSEVFDVDGASTSRTFAVEPGGRASGETTEPGASQSETTQGATRFNWITFLDHTEWETGRTGQLSLSTRVSVVDIYGRLSAAQSRVGGVSLGDTFLLVLAVIACLFLIIEAVALLMGFTLARSITQSVHALFAGTERVRHGDYGHSIAITTRDQLGELADSFNTMMKSVKKALQEEAEKKRLEEELRIARKIQQSLLPRGTFSIPGLAVTALCEPAREVGGDYYDFFRLSSRRLGVLIADVAGKGTSAALYMAELKGLVLSLCEIYHSPRQLLIEANRIISDHLDNRSFITMTYAVLDLEAQTLTYARAGHTPLLYAPSGRSGVQVLVPDGMVVGLRFDGVTEKFEELLEECTLPIQSGDVFVLFTDGITEAMNENSDLFGEERLSRLVEEHGDLPSEELRERIIREVRAFASGEPHDDMTIILLKIQEIGVVRSPMDQEQVAV